MPEISIQRSISINSEVKKVREVLLDFHQWSVWSPWLIQEPECRMTVAEDGKSYAWEGVRVGSGSMKIIAPGDTLLEYELQFIKPWKSKAAVSFSLDKKADDNVEVTWSMKSSLPFFMFWMKKMMEVFVGMDYERGLAMLRAYVETGGVPTKLEFDGVSKFDGCQYIGLRKQTALSTIGEVMAKDCEALGAYVKEQGDVQTASMFCIYHKFAPVKGLVDYEVGIPVSSVPSSIVSPFVSGVIPALDAYRISHIGGYQYLGNAWSALYAMERAKEIKCNKGTHPFEVYLNMPGEVEEAELRTQIYFPIKT